MQSKMAVVLFAIAVSAAAAMMVSKPDNATAAATAPTAKNLTAADVAKLHHKMETIAGALEAMLKPEHPGSLAKARVAPALRSFVGELRTTLSATASPTNLPAAIKRLRDAEAGMVGLTKELNRQQERLAREDATEETNLLLGVLMVRRGEPMAKQLEVLKTPDFIGLPVSSTLLSNHDDKTPLFQQVAAYMDKHGVIANSTDADAKARQLAKTLAYFEEKAEKMEHEDDVMQRSHKERVTDLEKLIKTGDKATVHSMQREKKHVEREYKKRFAMHKEQTKVMRNIVSALKRGDSAALKQAQEALQAHLHSMKAQTGNFLYLLQLGHRLAQRDCPFCVAQCIGKCHDGGNPYAKCMTECATAGQ